MVLNDGSLRRRQAISASGLTIVSVPGCTSLLSGNNDGNDSDNGGDNPAEEIIAGPDGSWSFEPDEVTISVNDTVEWYFDSSNHNITSHPDAYEDNKNPDGAEPFTSYEGNDHMGGLVPAGETFEHTFEVSGEYVYCCTPHIPQMVGTIYVER